MKVDFYRHQLGEAELAGVKEVLASTFLSAGPKTRELESRLAAYFGVDHAVGLSSCTAALQLCLEAWGIGAGHEVIVPAMTFAATSNVVVHRGAKPVFVDVEAETGLIAPGAVDAAMSDRTRAVVPVHLYGQMADMRALAGVVRGRDVKLLEDAAHCVEGVRDGAKPGTVGDAAALSFYATKNLAAGEGGAVVCRDEALAERLRRSRLHGMDRSAADRYHGKYAHWDIEEIGHKANMFDLQAALLLPQLSTLEDKLARRERICRFYEERFAAAGIGFPRMVPDARSARHLFTIWVAPAKRDDVLAAVQERGVGVAVNYRAVHLLSFYRKTYGYAPGAFPNAERIGDSTITLPLYPTLRDEEVEYVADTVTRVVRDLDAAPR